MRARTTQTTRAFTLIELLVTIIIIAILMGLLLVGFSAAIRGARSAAARQDASALRMGVEQFRTQFGFLPPLVKDGYPGQPGSAGKPIDKDRPVIFDAGVSADRDYLRDETPDADYRYSVHSIPYYLMCALGKDVDGFDGPSAYRPTREGYFDPRGSERYEALFEPKGGGVVDVDQPAGQGRLELQDRNGVAYRFYRWLPGDTNGEVKSADDFNYPLLLDNPRAGAKASDDNVALRSAEFAIVSAGPDGVFGDIPIEDLATIETALGKRFGGSDADEKAEEAARRDNIVEVGR